jgi:predicted nucleic acid-binding protein
MDAFDADIVIYASKGDPRGAALSDAVSGRANAHAGIGSVVLLTETLTLGDSAPHDARLREVLAALVLVPIDADIARVAAALRATYRLNTPDALHLATAIVFGADRFITGNRRDFTTAIKEIPVIFPS